MLLSIVIPTFNRSNKLDNILGMLVKQIAKTTANDIEIIVSDNNSSDNTKNIVARHIKNATQINIKYQKNKINIGFDANVDAAISKATGCYSWILSDDDEIVGTAIENLLTTLRNQRRHDVNFVFVNYTVCQDKKETPSGYLGGENKIVSGVELFSEIKLSNTFVSSNIFRTESWKQLSPQKYFGSLWIHVFAARDILRNGSALVIAQPHVKMRQTSLLESRNEKEDSGPYVDYYTDAHFKLCDFVKTLTQHGYPEKSVAPLRKFCTSGEYGHILNLKLVKRDSEYLRSFYFGKLLFEARMNSVIPIAGKVVMLVIPSFAYRLVKRIKKFIKS